MALINIISNLDSKWGLKRDLRIMEGVLKSDGHQVTSTHWNKSRGTSAKKYDMNIHDELVGGRHFRCARRNILSPHPEWFMWPERHPRFHGVFCKTKHAIPIFQNMGFRNCQFTGFTSDDMSNGTTFAGKEYAFLHIAGNSVFKGTARLVNTWLANPDFPMLYLYSVNENLDFRQKVKDAKNIEHHFGFAPRAEIVERLNKVLFYVAPSEAEGFGHCIVEPLSCGAIVIGTDAPPMNEYPTLNATATPIGLHHYGMRYDATGLGNAIKFALTFDEGKLEGMTKRNRSWWELNDITFKQTFKATVRRNL